MRADADGVVLVVRAGQTPRDASLRARRQLEAVGAKVIGFVFTDAAGGQVYARSYQVHVRAGEVGTS